jgi:hypothetical protein
MQHCNSGRTSRLWQRNLKVSLLGHCNRQTALCACALDAPTWRRWIWAHPHHQKSSAPTPTPSLQARSVSNKQSAPPSAASSSPHPSPRFQSRRRAFAYSHIFARKARHLGYETSFFLPPVSQRCPGGHTDECPANPASPRHFCTRPRTAISTTKRSKSRSCPLPPLKKLAPYPNQPRPPPGAPVQLQLQLSNPAFGPLATESVGPLLHPESSASYIACRPRRLTLTLRPIPTPPSVPLCWQSGARRRPPPDREDGGHRSECTDMEVHPVSLVFFGVRFRLYSVALTLAFQMLR